MNGTYWLRGGMAGFALALAASFGNVQPVLAQAAAGPGWTAWLGCWEPVPAEGAAVQAVTPYLCFLPGSDGARVEAVTVESGAITNRQTLDASGASIAVTREECSGTEAMQWSSDATRLYQRSTYNCPGGLQRQSTAVFSMTATGDWLDVAAVSVGESTNVRIIRYRVAPEIERALPEIAQALDGRGMSRETARAAAMAPVDRVDLVEATNHVHAAALEGWLIELGQPFRMDRARVVEMADAGLPERVIDVMVALSYPNAFAIDRAGRPTELPANTDPAVGGVAMMDPWLTPYMYRGLYNGFYPNFYNSYYMYDPYYSPYGYGGYGYNGYGYGGYGPGYNRPIIVVVPEGGQGDDAASDGRLVNGRGYTRGGSSEPRSSSGPSRSSSGSSGAASSDDNSEGASGSSGSGGGSTGRTARPKD